MVMVVTVVTGTIVAVARTVRSMRMCWAELEEVVLKVAFVVGDPTESAWRAD